MMEMMEEHNGRWTLNYPSGGEKPVFNPNEFSIHEGVVVRKATVSDWPAVVKLVLALAEYEKLAPPDEAAQKRLYNDTFGPTPRINITVAFLNNTPVSYMILLETYSSFLALPTLYIEDLFVLEPYRKQKVGYSQFMFAVNEAKRRGCGRMEWSVLTWNKLAIDFYERLGAKRLTEWHYYRLESADLNRLVENNK